MTLARPAGARAQSGALPGGPAKVAAAVVALAAATIVPLLRQRPRRSWQTLCCEDGWLFYQDARDDGLIDPLFRGFAGYSQLPPRLLGAVASLVPLDRLALFAAVAASLTVALLAAFVYWTSRGWIPSRWLRGGLAAFLVLMPAMGSENTATMTNTIWTFAAVVPWALLALGDETRQIAVRAAVVFLGATATALSLLYLPLAVGVFVVRRTRDSAVVLASYLVGSAVQVLVMLHTVDDRPALEPERDLGDLVDLIGSRVFVTYLGGDSRAWEWRVSHGAWLGVAVALGTLALVAVLAARADRRHRVVGLTLVIAAVLTFTLPALGRGTNTFGLVTQPDDAVAVRFSVVPAFLLASAFAVLISGARSCADRSRASRVLVGVFLVHLVVVSAASFTAHNYRGTSPDWRSSVERAAQQCASAEDDTVVRVIQDASGMAFVELRCDEVGGIVLGRMGSGRLLRFPSGRRRGFPSG